MKFNLEKVTSFVAATTVLVKALTELTKELTKAWESYHQDKKKN